MVQIGFNLIKISPFIGVLGIFHNAYKRTLQKRVIFKHTEAKVLKIPSHIYKNNVIQLLFKLHFFAIVSLASVRAADLTLFA